MAIVLPEISVEPVWKGETVAIVASGPSLRDENLDLLRGVRVIALNDSMHAVPRADVLLLCDPHWIREHPDLSAYLGPLIVVLRAESVQRWDRRMVAMVRGPHTGLSRHKRELAGNHTAVSHALAFADLIGAARIVLLGVDLQPGPSGERHFGSPERDTQDSTRRYADMAMTLFSQARPLMAKRVEVINCSPRSKLTCFRKASLRAALAGE